MTIQKRLRNGKEISAEEDRVVTPAISSPDGPCDRRQDRRRYRFFMKFRGRNGHPNGVETAPPPRAYRAPSIERIFMPFCGAVRPN